MGTQRLPSDSVTEELNKLISLLVAQPTHIDHRLILPATGQYGL